MRQFDFSSEGAPVWLLEFCGSVFGSIIEAWWSLSAGSVCVLLSCKLGSFSPRESGCLFKGNPNGILEVVKVPASFVVFSIGLC